MDREEKMSEQEFIEHKKYLQGATLRWKKWEQYQENWDHDHCEFCFKVFLDVEKYKNSLEKTQSEQRDDIELSQEGYTTEDNYHWICKQCYEKFKEKFQWKIAND